jgi:hypothetical protein
MSTAASMASMSMPFWKAGGSQRAMIAEPATRYFQPTILPPDRLAEIMSR